MFKVKNCYFLVNFWENPSTQFFNLIMFLIIYLLFALEGEMNITNDEVCEHAPLFVSQQGGGVARAGYSNPDRTR